MNYLILFGANEKYSNDSKYLYHSVTKKNKDLLTEFYLYDFTIPFDIKIKWILIRGFNLSTNINKMDPLVYTFYVNMVKYDCMILCDDLKILEDAFRNVPSFTQ
jgi:hypothetical protein